VRNVFTHKQLYKYCPVILLQPPNIRVFHKTRVGKYLEGQRGKKTKTLVQKKNKSLALVDI
jgi:hypothetical protein